VKSSSYISAAGYRKKYGCLTLVNYWLEQQPGSAQTPDLWKVSAQPVTAVKDAVGVFMDYIQEVDCKDRVGLVIYNSPSQTAVLEYPLSSDFAQIQNTAQHRQAGHYDQFTNIGAGIHQARLELASHARPGAFKMIVLMTDGQANRPYDESYAKSYVLEQAQAVAQEKYPIVTVSLGNAADTGLMQQVADITKGVHFNIPGGQAVINYRANLLEVFRKTANDRPLVLVK
jgi:Mg-chelatase subunit ChlD